MVILHLASVPSLTLEQVLPVNMLHNYDLVFNLL